jgi:AcrR family transcriptional regulator
MTEDEVTARSAYAAAAMEDIAADAGVTTLVVQRHFDSKEASYCRVLQRVSELVAQQLRAA